MTPMYLYDVENNVEPKGDYAELIETLRNTGSPIPQIMHLFAFNPAATQHLRQFTQAVMRGPSPLSPAFRELIAAFVSSCNRCKFCSRSHAAVAAKLYENASLIDAVLDDYRTAPLSDAERKLFAYLERLTLAPASCTAEDAIDLRSAGWSDEAIYDAITVCAMFNFYNRWVEGSGVQDMSPEGYARSAERIATIGYAGAPVAANR